MHFLRLYNNRWIIDLNFNKNNIKFINFHTKNIDYLYILKLIKNTKITKKKTLNFYTSKYKLKINQIYY